MRLPHRGRLFRAAGLTLSALLLAGGVATCGQEKKCDGTEHSGGLYVAVGYGGRRMSSPDGIHWTNDVQLAADSGDDDNCLFSVAFAQGKFVAVGGGASVGHVLITPDGKTWRDVYTARTRIVPMLYGGRFVAGCGHDLLVSPDAEHWQAGAPLPYERGLYFRRGAFGNGVFVLCGDCDIAPGQPRGGWFATTKDGTALARFDTSLPNTRSLAFGAGRFVLVGEQGYRATSADGKTWQAASDPKEDFRWVFYTGKQFLLGGNVTYASPDGLVWTKIEGSIPCEPQCRGDRGFSGASWKTNLWHSADALQWRKVSDTGTNAFTSIAFGRFDTVSPKTLHR